MLEWQWLPFDRLSVAQLYAVLALRQQVFVVEQRCAFLDADGVDPQCWHGLGERDGVLLASARIVPPGADFAEPAIGRVVTAPSARGQGLGRELMREAIAQAQRLYPGEALRIGAQQHLERFYGSLGFVTASAPYDEDGIPHVEMLRGGSGG
jgi:ElaA protein